MSEVEGAPALAKRVERGVDADFVGHVALHDEVRGDGFGEGNNDRISFASNESGEYIITPTYIERGTDKLTFDNRDCSGGFNDGNECDTHADCRSNDRVVPDDGLCLGYIERIAVLGDTPVKAQNNDTYRVAASRATIFTISDLSGSTCLFA